MKNHAALNRIYRLVWSQVNNCWVAVAETAKGRGKSATKRKLSIAALALVPTLALAGLDGGVIVGGQGTIVNSNLVQQDSSRLAINAQGFGVAAGEAFTLRQNFTTDMALIRVLGQNPSDILGSINAKGQLFISNPNGILFGRDSQINVGGLVGSSLDISRDDFMSGNYTFSNTGTAGSVVNQGTLTATDGGYIALLAPQVRNEGVIRTTMGTSLIGAGDEITLNISNNSLLSYTIDKGAVNALAENRQLIHADGGQVFMGAKAADALSTAVVNNTGIIKAGRVVNEGGVISLQGDYVSQTGTLDASGTSEAGDINIDARIILDAGRASANSSTGNGGNITYNASSSIIQTAAAKTEANSTASSGQGGTVHLQAGNNFYSSGTITATGTGSAGQGGTIDALGNRVVLAAATLDASGTSQGGLVRVGGDFHGTNPDIQNAQTTIINGATNIKADGGKGQVVAWSDDQTDFYGSISADKAGMIEVSSKGTLTYSGDASAGVGGKLLLDPANIIIDAAAGVAAYELYDPDPANNNYFGDRVVLLGTTVNGVFTENGKVVISSGNNSLFQGAGAVYLFDVTTGGLISSLTGIRAYDSVGNTIKALTNGNYVVLSSVWSNGMITNAGALTWGSGTVGVSGTVSSINSLVGSHTNDYLGGGVSYGNSLLVLSNGNYVIAAPQWYGSRGAVTWGNGLGGTVGEVSIGNSLTGSQIGENVGSGGLTELTNGNYVVASPFASNYIGAVTWMNGATGKDMNGAAGNVNGSNSLMGANPNDYLGRAWNQYEQVIKPLSNGNYVVICRWCDDGSLLDAGAVTWINGATGLDVNGLPGVVGSGNSLITDVPWNSWSYSGANIGVYTLNNGNYVVQNANWGNGSIGAATWMNGTTGKDVNGATSHVNSSNSLVGSQAGDYVGNNITALSNGNYVVSTEYWDNGAVVDAGAATWMNGATGKDVNGATGSVSSSNSLVGSQAGDYVGSNITALSNGNYVVGSFGWDNGAVMNAGAATWGNGLGGTVGAVSEVNSLVGSQTNDYVGIGRMIALSNGNYVVGSYNWDNGTVVNAGAATWMNGATGKDVNGANGHITSSNSLVGSQADDSVGINVTALSNGNYVVSSYNWDNGTVVNAGAATWMNGATGKDVNGATGPVSSSNSLVGSQTDDYVGVFIQKSNNGYYLVFNYEWDNGSVVDAGAATWINGDTGLDMLGLTGVVSSNNSLVGSQQYDGIGCCYAKFLSNGNYVLANYQWHNGAVFEAGAATWGNGSSGTAGVIGSNNSLVGTTDWEDVGYNQKNILTLSNGNYIVASPWGPNLRGWVKVATPGNIAFNNGLGQTMTFNAGQLTSTLATGTDVTLQASNDITVNQDILVSGSTGGSLTMQAGRNINLNADITTANGDFTAIAGDPGAVLADLQPGTPTITLGAGASINAGTGTVTLNAIGGNIVDGGVINAGEALLQATGNISLEAGSNINTAGTATLVAGGNFANNSGSSTPITASQWFIYSTGKANNVLGGIVADGQHYEQTYTGSIPAYASNGNWLMYSMTPHVLYVSPTTQVVDLGTAPTSFTYTLNGFVNGDNSSIANITGTATFTGGSTAVGYHNIDYVNGLSSSLDYIFANRVASVDELIVMAPGTTPVTPPQPVTRPTIGANAYAAATNVSNNVSPTTSQFGNESFVHTTDAERPYVLTEVVAFERDASGAAIDINALDFDGNGSSDEIRSMGKLELVLEDGGVHLPDDLLDSTEKKKSAIHKVPRVIRTKHML